jgi:hypothetical protein
MESMAESRAKSQKGYQFDGLTRVVCVVVAIALPLALALRGAWTLSMSAIGQQGQETERVKTQEIRSESRALSDEVSSEIETLQLRALATYLLGKFEPGIADSSLHAVAVLTAPNPESQALVKQYEVANVIAGTTGPFASSTAQNPPNPIATQDLSNAAHSIVMKDIQSSGVSIVSMSTKSAKDDPLVGLAFDAPNGKVLLAVVDPIVAFAGVSKWAMGREGEMLRGYVVGPNGRILIHSEKAYNGSDFSNNTFFRQALQPTLRGERVGGVGIFSAVDTLKARTSYSQLRALPFVVVAERVVRGTTTTLLKRMVGPALLMTIVLTMACLLSIVLLLRVFAQRDAQRDAEMQTLRAKNSVKVKNDSASDLQTEIQEEIFDEILDDMIESPGTKSGAQLPMEVAATQIQRPVKTNELPS